MSILHQLCFGERWGSILTQPSSPTEPVQDLCDEVNRFSLRPLHPDEFVVFTLDLCHNQVDRHGSRFPDDELEVINRLVPGRPLMERHDLRGSLPKGTFFRSMLHISGDHISVRPSVYVLQLESNRDFIANIEGGIYRETSIGFTFSLPECSICGKDIRRCIHVPGKQYDSNLCFYWLRGVQEVIEGSVVASGSQGTRFISELRSMLGEKASRFWTNE